MSLRSIRDYCIEYLKKEDIKKDLKEIIKPIISGFYNEFYIYIWLLCFYIVFFILVVLANLVLLVQLLKRNNLYVNENIFR